jgi:acyl-CoA synthetase (AMP-forming)/AMP-acid ligase II
MSGRLDDLLSRAAARWPERPAVTMADGGERLTYQELEARAGSLRDVLVRNGVGAGDRVAVCAPKSTASLAAILGVLQAGAAYVPVDPTAPPARGAYVIDDCAVAAAVVASDLLPALREAGTTGLEGLEPWGDAPGDHEIEVVRGPGAGGAGREEGADTTALAYVLYTSGSTGRPKGVVHTHESALSFVRWCAEVFDLSEGDRFYSRGRPMGGDV